ncbi:hypothetical protein ANCDUO_19906, partial [Ancylostoma duodenale]
AAVTIVGGHVAWKDGKIQEAKGSFVQLAASSPYLFSVVQQRDKISTAEKVDRGDSASASNGMPPRRAGQEPAHDRPIPRKSHLESNISFGNGNGNALGNPDKIWGAESTIRGEYIVDYTAPTLDQRQLVSEILLEDDQQDFGRALRACGLLHRPFT